MQKRHLDTGLHDYDFRRGEQWIKCPKCQQQAILKSMPCHDCQNQKRIVQCRCGYCFDSHKDNPPNQHKKILSFSERCHHCFRAEIKIHKIYPAHQTQFPKKISATCPKCQQISHFKVIDAYIHQAWKNRYEYLTQGDYNFELFLQIPTRHGIIVAYNPQHLAELKQFIEADLRERHTDIYYCNSSYFSRLPAWIKSARHRKEILKAIARLEQMILN